jgi:NADH-quinone oxidoreductase subunit H
MILIAALTAVMFFGGWQSFFEGDLRRAGRPAFHPAAPGLHWLVLKIAFFMFCFLWFRATFPRYRYDQIMRLGWKVFIPVTLVWIVVEGAMVATRSAPGAPEGARHEQISSSIKTFALWELLRGLRLTLRNCSSAR